MVSLRCLVLIVVLIENANMSLDMTRLCKNYRTRFDKKNVIIRNDFPRKITLGVERGNPKSENRHEVIENESTETALSFETDKKKTIFESTTDYLYYISFDDTLRYRVHRTN